MLMAQNLGRKVDGSKLLLLAVIAAVSVSVWLAAFNLELDEVCDLLREIGRYDAI